MNRVRWIGMLGGIALIGALVLALDYLSGFIIFGGRTASDFNRPAQPPCNEWHHTYTFANHRQPGTETSIQIPSCETTQKKRATSHFVTNQHGLRIHYLTFVNQEDLPPSTPIWFHVHGITSSWLHGARYLGSARRLGFRLVLIELQNHGRSARHSRGASWGCQERWDVIAVLNQLEQTYPAAPILLAATSMGTIASTQAAITSPATFAPVRAMVYESPVSLIDSLFSGVGQRLDLNDSTINKAYKFLTTLSQLRTDVDFAKCAKRLRAKNRQVEIPTLLQISATEYELPAERSFFDTYPFHSRVQVKVYKRGSHSAYWNYQPEEFEVDLENFWQRHQTVPPAAKHELSTPAQGS